LAEHKNNVWIRNRGTERQTSAHRIIKAGRTEPALGASDAAGKRVAQHDADQVVTSAMGTAPEPAFRGG
jgi:hypothetical protein